MKKIVFFISIFCLIISPEEIFSQVIEATFEASEGSVFIYYELKNAPDMVYEVKVKLKRTSDPSFELIPSVLIGDIGKGKFAGGRRTIIWHINSREEALIEGEDFYFEIMAEEIDEENSGIPWYVYAGGALLGGGAAAFFLLKKDNGGVNTVATPPGRP